MKKCVILLVLLACCLGGEPTTQPGVIDGGIFAQALAEIYPDEGQLIQDVQSATPGSPYQHDALQAAVLNKWDGPFKMRDFSKWLKDNHLDGMMRVFRDDIGAGQVSPIMSHAPTERFHNLRIVISLGESVDDLFLVAVDKQVRSYDVEPFLLDVPAADKGDGPVVYDLRAANFPSSLERLEEKGKDNGKSKTDRENQTGTAPH